MVEKVRLGLTPDGLRVVGDGASVFVLAEVRQPTMVVSVRLLRNDAYDLREVGDGAIVLLVIEESPAAEAQRVGVAGVLTDQVAAGDDNGALVARIVPVLRRLCAGGAVASRRMPISCRRFSASAATPSPLRSPMSSGDLPALRHRDRGPQRARKRRPPHSTAPLQMPRHPDCATAAASHAFHRATVIRVSEIGTCRGRTRPHPECKRDLNHDRRLRDTNWPPAYPRGRWRWHNARAVACDGTWMGPSPFAVATAGARQESGWLDRREAPDAIRCRTDAAAGAAPPALRAQGGGQAPATGRARAKALQPGTQKRRRGCRKAAQGPEQGLRKPDGVPKEGRNRAFRAVMVGGPGLPTRHPRTRRNPRPGGGRTARAPKQRRGSRFQGSGCRVGNEPV